MSIEAVTEREILIKLDTTVTQLKEAVLGFTDALTKLEETKIKDLEREMAGILKWKAEFSGAYKIVALIGLVLGFFATIKSFL